MTPRNIQNITFVLLKEFETTFFASDDEIKCVLEDNIFRITCNKASKSGSLSINLRICTRYETSSPQNFLYLAGTVAQCIHNYFTKGKGATYPHKKSKLVK